LPYGLPQITKISAIFTLITTTVNEIHVCKNSYKNCLWQKWVCSIKNVGGQRYNEQNASSLSIRGSLEAGNSSQNYKNAILHHMHQGTYKSSKKPY